MSDDIDIEEHDIFESPIIKAIFPDISEIKKELDQYLGDDVTIKEDPDSSTVDENKLVHHVHDTRIKAEEDINIDRNINAPLNIATGFLKTKVMGSKPNINAGISTKHAGNVKEKFASEDLEREHTLKNSLQSSDVIIGSKSGSRLTDSDKNIVKKSETLVRKPNVNLQDIEAHLKQSKRYCIKCKTLFPNRHNYNKHMKHFHVIKSATKNSKTMKTRQNSLKIRIQLLEEKKVHYKHKCSMCGLRFGTLFRLSQHHRNIHQAKASLTKARNMKNIHMCSICQSSFTDRNNLNRHHRVFHMKATIPSLNNRDSRNKSKKELENRNIKKKKQTKLQTSKLKVTSNTCTICNIHFCSMYSLKRHTKNIHKIKNKKNIHNNEEISFLQAEPEHKNNNKSNNNNEFETLQPCFHCDEIFPSQASLISHIYSILGLKEMSEIQEKNETVDSGSVKFEPMSIKNRIVFENDDVNNILKVQENNTIQDEKKDTSKTSFDDEFLDTESHLSVATVDIPRLKNKRKLEKSEPQLTKRRALDVFEYQTITANSLPKKSELEVQKLSTIASESPEGNASNTEFKRYKFRIVSAPRPIYVSPTLPYPEFERMRKFVLESIIYKCNKCDINFLSSYIAKEHNKHTELLVNWKCSVCKKYFKQYDKHLHLKQHEYSKTINVCEFNETELSRLLYNCTKCTIHFTEERYLKHFPKCGIQAADSVYCKNCDILIDKCEFASHEELHKMENSTNDIIVMTGELIIASEEQDDFTTKKQKNKQKNRLFFCNSCKCYLTDKAITRKAHIKGTCSNIVKYTCDLCGLVFTNKSINTHREHHKQRKDLNLHDYTFFDRKGNQIPPPIPSYNHCKNCDIIFLHKNAANTHLCSEMEYKVCKLCNVKLTESAFKLHIHFHMYSMQNDDFKFTEHTSKHACDVSAAQEKQREKGKINKLEHIRLTTEPYCKVLIKTDSSKEVTVTKMTTAIEPENGHDSIVLNCEDESEQMDDVIFTCQSCEISTTSYDKVIEHCQNHYDPTTKTTNDTIICKTCSLKFDANSHEKHQKFHYTNSGETKNVHFLRFDPTYFTADNTIWTQHVFASLTPSKQNEIVEKSIYPPECRIKMDIIQKGPYHLTVYKCNGCGHFIDPDFVIEHFEEACHRKCRKYPCPLCGLSLYTSEYRAKHVKIHNV